MRFLPLTISEMKNLESEERIMSEKHQNESEGKDLGGQLQCILRSLVGAARKNRGMITRDQLEQALEELQLSGEQEKLVEEYLKQNNIGIDEPLDAEEKLSEEEADYLREYTEMVNAMEQPSDGEREAIEIQAMAGEGEVTEEEILDAIRITGNRIESLEDSEAADAGKGN